MPVFDTEQYFHHLIHDAALYPPGNAPMNIAITDHLLWRAETRGFIVGPFLCPSFRLAELQSFLGQDQTLDIALIGSDIGGLVDACSKAQNDGRLLLSHLEFALPTNQTFVTLASLLSDLPDVTTYVEIPRSAGWEETLDLLEPSRNGAKLRTGGLTSDAFPTEEEVALFLYACFARGLSFKFTAGLHSAARHRDKKTGFEYHGFLNLFLAVCQVIEGSGFADTVAILSEEDSLQLGIRLSALDPAVVERARMTFFGYGSCSLKEPYEELLRLRLIGSNA